MVRCPQGSVIRRYQGSLTRSVPKFSGSDILVPKLPSQKAQALSCDDHSDHREEHPHYGVVVQQ